MQRLSGLDANFLYNETPTEHMHTLKLAVLDPPPEGMMDPADAVAEIGRRLGQWPAFRRRVVDVPLHLHHPVWIDAGEPDLGHHVRRARIGGTGSDADMDALVGRIASRPLDRSRPLWEAWLLEGRADGRVAVLLKIHHSVADGGAANSLLGAIMGDEAQESTASVETARAEEVPGRFRLLRGAARDVVRELWQLPGRIGDTRRAVARRKAAAEDLAAGGLPAPPRPVLDTPATSLNRALTAGRSVATVSLPLGPLLEVRRRYGATLNDVLLTLVGGALTTVLAERGETPQRSLTAGVPVASERPTPDTPPRLSGNKVSNVFVSLATETTDPAERLVQVHDNMAAAKALHEALGGHVMESWLEYTPPRPYSWMMRRYSALDLADRHRAPFNVVVSSVAGPRRPLEVAGAGLVHFFSAGPVLEGIGVNVTAWSYVDHLDVMVVGCSRLLPDAAAVTDAMREQAELLLAVGKASRL